MRNPAPKGAKKLTANGPASAKPSARQAANRRERNAGAFRGERTAKKGFCQREMHRILSRRYGVIVARHFIAWYPCKKANRPGGYGMIGSDRRATIRTTNQPGIRIRPSLMGRILD